MAYVIIVEFLAKPDKVEAFAELIDRHAHNSRTLEDGCLAFDVCQDPQDPGRFVFYDPGPYPPGSESALPHHPQVLTRRPSLSE
jgi:Antibiotic biosynthesis monooxygenase